MLSFYLLSKFFPLLFNVQSFFFLFWTSFDIYLFSSQIILLYLLYKITSTTNPFKKTFLLFFILWVHGSFIFYYQAEVFACFLLVNELMVCLFIFLLMIYCGFDSIELNTRPTHFSFVWVVVLGTIGIYSQTPMFHYIIEWDDWDWQDYYLSLIYPTYNDLVSLYYFFYYITPPTLILIGFFLFILSIIYIYLFFKILSSDRVSFFKQNNNTEGHNMQKPSVNFFKTTFNDL